VTEARDRGVTVFVSSHILSEMEALCDRVTIIRAGKTVESGSLESMRHLSRLSIRAELLGDPGDLSQIKGVEDVTVEGNVLRAQLDPDALNDFIRVLAKVGVRSLVSQPPSLEEIFLRHYKLDESNRQVTGAGTVSI
jgi:ABC-2 type transport system ATP-binding protein